MGYEGIDYCKDWTHVTPQSGHLSYSILYFTCSVSISKLKLPNPQSLEASSFNHFFYTY
ncbi:hypothetical protein BDZ94DRAFT_1248872 [Collybia nuda]|uniref:Uncharacterized protein n=1 Tax=Collybia nuda TaxID=64659 RepID=A0A9P6CID7_9AGAR|nr:hypothetical protein BDZ94DRAFT_1248872 [Collybia nuda]